MFTFKLIDHCTGRTIVGQQRNIPNADYLRGMLASIYGRGIEIISITYHAE